MKTLETIRKGEEEFETLCERDTNKGGFYIAYEGVDCDKIIPFNKQNLTNILTSLKEEIEGMKKEVPTVKVKVGDHPLKEYGDMRVHGKAVGYNKAIQDIQDLLEEIVKGV